MAVGSYDNAGVVETLIEMWDGSNWSIVSTPNIGSIDDNRFFGVS